MRSRREGELAAAYQRARPRLLRLAYATLGSRTEAEDVVSECWLRLAAADAREPVRDVEGWAVTAVARAALDTLRSARLRRDLYIGPWLPEPVVEFTAGNCDPADRVSLDDAVSRRLGHRAQPSATSGSPGLTLSAHQTRSARRPADGSGATATGPKRPPQ